MATKNRKVVKKAKRVRYFGIVKLALGHKGCWISKHDKNGWSLGYAINKRTVWLTGLRFKTHQEISRVLGSGVVLVALGSEKIGNGK